MKRLIERSKNVLSASIGPFTETMTVIESVYAGEGVTPDTDCDVEIEESKIELVSPFEREVIIIRNVTLTAKVSNPIAVVVLI